MLQSHEITLDEEKHVYIVDGIERPSVTTILSLLSYENYGKVDKATLEYASRRGTDIHEATESLDLGFPADVDGETEPYVNAYIDFCRDYQPNYQMIETPIYDEEFGYSGTVDRMGTVGTQLWLIDIKTIGSPTRTDYVKVCLQTWMYAHALDGHFRNFALFLKKDGSYRLFDCNAWAKENGIEPQKIIPQLVDTYKLIQSLKRKEK